MFQFSVSMVSFVPILYLLVEVLWPTQDTNMETREGLHHSVNDDDDYQVIQ